MAYGDRTAVRFLVPPLKVVDTMWSLFTSKQLLTNVQASLGRILSGVGLSILLAVPLGILIGRVGLIERILLPTIEMIRPVPVPAWVPLVVLVFGIGQKPAIMLIALAAFFPIILNTIHGVKYVPPLHIQAAQMLGASPSRILIKVVLPSALPNIFTGIRLGLGIGVMAVVLAELMAVRSGIGYMILIGQTQLETDIVLAGIITVSALGFALSKLLESMERVLLRWRL